MFKFGLAAFSCYLILYYPNSLVNPVSPRGTPECSNTKERQCSTTGLDFPLSPLWTFLFGQLKPQSSNVCFFLYRLIWKMIVPVWDSLACIVCSVVSNSLWSLDCSPPGSSVHGILQARILGCHFLLQGIFPTHGSNLHFLHLLHWQADSLPLVPPRKPRVWLT